MGVEMNLKKYLKHLNNEFDESVGGFAIDSFSTKKKVLSVPYPTNESIDDYDNQKTKRIMIDLDGVIHQYEGFKDGTLYGNIFDGAKEAIDYLRNNGYEVIIFTSRLSKKLNDNTENQKVMIKKWLNKNKIKVDDITSEKLAADLYMDDRAIHFKGDWNNTLDEIKLRLDEGMNK
jgi:hypothetical protein